MDCEASCNIIPATLISSNITLEKYNQVLVMYSKTILMPILRPMRQMQAVDKKPMKQEMLVDTPEYHPLLGSKGNASHGFDFWTTPEYPQCERGGKTVTLGPANILKGI